MLLKLIGHRFDTRFTWGEFVWKLHPKNWVAKLELTTDGECEHDMLIIAPLIFAAYIHLPTRFLARKATFSDEPGYGFYVYPQLWRSENLVLCWGLIRKHLDLPWMYQWESTELLTQTANLPFLAKTVAIEKPGSRIEIREWQRLETTVSETHDYTYTMKSGDVQHRRATIHVERRTWHRKWFPFLRKARTSIDVRFDAEVGEKTGSWKGGCIGCGYDMQPGETPLECLRRMERERKF